LAADRHNEIASTVLFAPTLWPNGWAVPRTLRFMKYVPQKQIANLFNFAETAPYGIKDERIREFAIASLQGEGRSMKDAFGRSGAMLWELRALRNVVRKQLAEVKQPT